jgi:hypothetical protein
MNSTRRLNNVEIPELNGEIDADAQKRSYPVW